MKRTISSYNYSSDSGDSIDRCTNRGNKLKRKARYVQEGLLDRPNGPKVYKKRIEHAGYYRNVISQNPKRYDVDGYRLEDDEEDEEADVAAAEENPYGGVVLHELLAPLTSAADLPTHPSLSVPYVAPMLGNMTQEACEMLQRERNIIRGVKQIMTKLRGDDTWIPCGSFDSEVDDMIFDTSKVFEECIRLRPSSKLTSSKENGNGPTTTMLQFEDTAERSPTAAPARDRNTEGESDAATSLSQADGRQSISTMIEPTSLSDRPSGTEYQQETNPTSLDGPGDTTARQDFEISGITTIGQLPQSEDHEASSLELSKVTTKTNESMTNETTASGAESEAVAKDGTVETDVSRPIATEQMQETELKRSPPDEETHDNPEMLSLDAKEDGIMVDAEGPEATNNGLQPIPHRMTTRAQAQAVSSENTNSSRTRSPSIASSILPSIHPLFLTPSSAWPDRDFGLPPDEAESTRRILMSYVQKQEEVCRGVEKLYDGFLQAQRMKKNVLDSCKAEGHVGEMSDGEDWYDKEEWGLEEDLRKGHDEDEDDIGTQHKKTRGRRA
ncbi:MAG: hypothetical protein LQ349_008943 [Xanthoria aureola]|nr:MAG: hypothetical protein LQ349_008943 [Xanthoria aureola]